MFEEVAAQIQFPDIGTNSCNLILKSGPLGFIINVLDAQAIKNNNLQMLQQCLLLANPFETNLFHQLT